LAGTIPATHFRFPELLVADGGEGWGRAPTP
jgi:hypothetical protein